MVRRIRHRINPQQFRRLRRDRFSHDDDSLHRSRCLFAQASLSTFRSPKVSRADASTLKDDRQTERGHSRPNHSHRFCRCSGKQWKSIAYISMVFVPILLSNHAVN
jgi:hypothetical protein